MSEQLGALLSEEALDRLGDLGSLLIEAFELNRPVPYRWASRGSSYRTAEFRVGGAGIRANFSISTGPSVGITFTNAPELADDPETARRQARASSYSMFDSKGNALSILATILAATRELDAEIEPVYINFSAASSRHGARARIYELMVKRFAANDWDMRRVGDSFYLTNRERKLEVDRLAALRRTADAEREQERAAAQPSPQQVQTAPRGASRRRAVATARRAEPTDLETISMADQRSPGITTRGPRRMVSAFSQHGVPYWLQFDLHSPELDGDAWEEGRSPFTRDVRAWATISFWLNGKSTLLPQDLRRRMRSMTPTQLGREVLNYGRPNELYPLVFKIVEKFVKHWNPEGLIYLPPDPSRTNLEQQLLRRLPGRWQVTDVGGQLIAQLATRPLRQEADNAPTPSDRQVRDGAPPVQPERRTAGDMATERSPVAEVPQPHTRTGPGNPTDDSEREAAAAAIGQIFSLLR